MLYSEWITAVCNILEYQVVDPTSATPTGGPFDTQISACINYVEDRLQRDLDLVATTTTASGTMTPGTRRLVLPSVDLPATGNIPDLIGLPVPAGTILTATNGSNIVNVNWPAHGLTVGQQCSLLNPVRFAGLTLGGVYSVITVINADNFTINVTFNATANASIAVIGNGIFIVAQQITPVVNGVRQQPLEWMSRPQLDFSWPSDSSPGAGVVPVNVCVNDQQSVLVGPAPDQAYGFEVVGTTRIPQLSSVNYTNFLTQQLPDLYVAASMVYLFGFQRDFGGQSEDPQTAQSWENQYQTLLKSAATEETRKRYSNMFPTPSKPTGISAQGATG